LKKVLAMSDFPKPKSQLLGSQLDPKQVFDEKVLKAGVEHMVKPVINGAPPSVIIMPQALARQGIFVLQTDQLKQMSLKSAPPR
jgi:hypothetical protein